MMSKTNTDLIHQFERVLALAELKALSTFSLENPLNEKQFACMMELKTIVFGGD